MELSYGVLAAISQDLGTAARRLDDSGATAPRGCDAGEATATVLSLVGALVQGAAGLSEELARAGAAVTAQLADVQHTDAGVAGWFRLREAR